MNALQVLDTGPLATVQDLGRPGHGDLGVGRSGAADRGSLRLANRLVGNPEDAAAVEVTLGGFAGRFTAPGVVAVTGAACAVTVDDRPAGRNAVVFMPAGSTLRLGPAERGLRCYVAVRGGLDVPLVLGSRSTDLLAGLGPPRLRGGVTVPIGEPAGELPEVEVAPVPDPPAGDVELRVVLGPRADWFSAAAHRALVAARWEVSSESDRVGMRLGGPALERVVDRELETEGVVRGALQVPPAGRPTLFLADHPVTGGYPVVACVLAADVDRAAQARPGQRLRFRALPARLAAADGRPP